MFEISESTPEITEVTSLQVTKVEVQVRVKTENPLNNQSNTTVSEIQCLLVPSRKSSYHQIQQTGTISLSEDVLTCVFSEPVSGIFKLELWIPKVGLARNPQSLDFIMVYPEVSNSRESEASFGGNSKMYILGSGFPSDSDKHLLDISICERKVEVVKSDFNRIELVTNGLFTTETQDK